jgi:D-amino-acid dehydrogenase
MRVCVLGGGVIGVTTAYYLARAGHRVTLLEQRTGVALDASFANGGQLSYSYVAPLAQPSVLPKLLGFLLQRDSALRFVPRLDLRQWRWSLAFLRACRGEVARRTTAHLLALSLYSRSLLHELVREESLDFDYEHNGKLVLYRNPHELDQAKRQMEFQSTLGCEQQALDPAACAELEPALAPLRSGLAGGIFTRSEDVGDCHKFTVELARVASEKYGADFHYGAKVEKLLAAGGRVEAVRTEQGDIEADAFVVALGMSSLKLLAPLGVTPLLYPLKGYSLTIPVEAGHSAPRVSITDADQKVVYARLGERLRIAGMIDITGMNENLDHRRLRLLQQQAHQTFPQGGDYSHATGWCGQRPATPGGKPVLGATTHENLWLNTGHGALGFTLACGSARLVADSIAQREPALDITLFRCA